jgi:Ca-activated chloride channel family protein
LKQAVFCQYYYRGELIDEKNKLIPNGIVLMHSNNMLYNAGSSGSFGIMSPRPNVDTFTINCEGYEKITQAVYSNKYNQIRLKLSSALANMQRNRLASLTKDFKSEKTQGYFASNETYSNLVENEFIDAGKFPLTGFAVNSDKASYSNIRRFINMKSQVPTDAVRIDEMVNYFNLEHSVPAPGKTFQINSRLTQCPWNKKNLLLFIHLTAKKLNIDFLPPNNLVFLIDNSGSMELQNRMPLLKSAFRLLVNNMREKDTISIVTYGGHVEIALPPISGKYQDSILKTIEAMEAGGDTPGESAIRIAYSIAKNNFIKNGNNRVILATDGDFNVGIADESELEKLITIQSQGGIYLTCLGIGMGNYKDSKLEALAKKGHGNFAYIDSELEAEKVLVKEMTETLFSVADNTFTNISFNPDLIRNYRLLGFDNKLNALADTGSKIDGGEVGSGYSNVVLFEIEPNEKLMKGTVQHTAGENIASVLIKFEEPRTRILNDCSYNCPVNFLPFDSLPNAFQFASAVAMFGGFIKHSSYMEKIVLDDVSKILLKCMDRNNRLQTEFYSIVEKAKKIYESGKGKRRKQAKSLQ